MAEEYAPKSPDLSSFFSAPAAPPTPPPQQHAQHHYNVQTTNLNDLPHLINYNHNQRRHDQHERAHFQLPVPPHQDPIHYPLSAYPQATSTTPVASSATAAGNTNTSSTAPIQLERLERPHYSPVALKSEYRQEPARVFEAAQPHFIRQQSLDRHPQQPRQPLHSEQSWLPTLQNISIHSAYDRRASHPPPHAPRPSPHQGQPYVVPGANNNQLPFTAAPSLYDQSCGQSHSYNQSHSQGSGQYQPTVLQQQQQQQQLQNQKYQPPQPAPQQRQQQAHQPHHHQTLPTAGPETMPPRRSAAAAAAAASSDSSIEPSPVKTKFPTARIKRIMQADEEVGKVAQQTPIAVGKALELFMVHVVTKSAEIAREKNSKRVTAHMLKQVIQSDGQYDFLADIAAKVGDDERKGGGRTSSGAKVETEESEEDFVEAEPKKRGRGGRKKKGSV